jgi:hypothetical protein
MQSIAAIDERREERIATEMQIILSTRIASKRSPLSKQCSNSRQARRFEIASIFVL